VKAYDITVKVMSLAFAVIGVVILVLTVSRGGGPLSLGFILGVIFLAIGIIRYRVQDRIGGGR
jgi:hypothetical protein